MPVFWFFVCFVLFLSEWLLFTIKDKAWLFCNWYLCIHHRSMSGPLQVGITHPCPNCPEAPPHPPPPTIPIWYTWWGTPGPELMLLPSNKMPLGRATQCPEVPLRIDLLLWIFLSAFRIKTEVTLSPQRKGRNGISGQNSLALQGHCMDPSADGWSRWLGWMRCEQPAVAWVGCVPGLGTECKMSELSGVKQNLCLAHGMGSCVLGKAFI